MKIGITLYDSYREYLEKIASLNHISITKVCSLICANFLSYNLKKKVFPKFRKFVSISFDEISESNVDNHSDYLVSGNVGSDSEYSHISRDELLKGLELVEIPEDPESSGLPFEYDSED